MKTLTVKELSQVFAEAAIPAKGVAVLHRRLFIDGRFVGEVQSITSGASPAKTTIHYEEPS